MLEPSLHPELMEEERVKDRTSPSRSVLRHLHDPQVLHKHRDDERQSDCGPCNAEDPDVDGLIAGSTFGGEPVQEFDAEPE
jgi:hypothetical protein